MRLLIRSLTVFARSLTVLLRRALELAANVLSPATCAACDAPLRARSVFCAPCARGVVPFEGGEVVAFGVFGGPLAKALRRFKYESRPDLGRSLGHLLRRAARTAQIEGGVVVPVPLHARRLAERGYNQAALLARAVADELGAPFEPRALVRVRCTPQQALLDRAARLKNVKSAFRVRDPKAIRDRRVVLVDDVATTGSTLSACTESLLEAGASSVVAVVVARADGRRDDDERSHARPTNLGPTRFGQ